MTRIAVVQLEQADDTTPDQQRRLVREMLSGIEADLVLLPELWEIGAFSVPENLDEAVTLAQWCDRMHDLAPGVMLHAGSFLERDGDHLYNTSVVFSDTGEVAGVYRKIHLFGFDAGEAVMLTAGDTIVTVETPLGTTGLATCYDLRFPEMFRALTDAGATSALIPTGWPTVRIAHWRNLAVARATENQMWVIGANSVGVSGDVEMGGYSLIADPWGATVAETADPGILEADIDPGLPERARRGFPVLRDRRL